MDIEAEEVEDIEAVVVVEEDVFKEAGIKGETRGIKTKRLNGVVEEDDKILPFIFVRICWKEYIVKHTCIPLHFEDAHHILRIFFFSL